MKKIILLISLMISSLFSSDATMSVINEGVALPRLVLQDATKQTVESNFKDKFFKIMLGDLKVSSDFIIASQERDVSFEGDSLTNINDNADLIFRYELIGSIYSALNLKVKLLDAKNGVVKYEKIYTMDNGRRYPFLAHKSVVGLVDELGLPPIAWMEKFIIFSKYTSVAQSQILVADYTLSYQEPIISSGLNIFPKWGNKEQSIFYYTTFVNKKPTLFRYNLKSGSRERVIQSDGMLIASDVSKDGNLLLLTMAPKDQPDIYTYDLLSKKLTKITDYIGIDVNGNFVDDDKRVVFVSDRLGYPNVFSVGVNGGVVEQMVFSGRENSSVSTFGNYIVYSSREANNEFNNSSNIYLISTKTDFIRQLTSNGKNTYPRFSSDGQSVVFIKQFERESSLGIIRINENKSFLFPLKVGKLQSIDW